MRFPLAAAAVIRFPAFDGFWTGRRGIGSSVAHCQSATTFEYEIVALLRASGMVMPQRDAILRRRAMQNRHPALGVPLHTTWAR